MALTVLQAGKHLLLENPQLSQQVRHGAYQLALANKVIPTLDFEFRFVPAWQQLANCYLRSMWGKSAWSKLIVSTKSCRCLTTLELVFSQRPGGALGALGP